jgi:nicotinate phosphoribosyltransferase
VTIPGGWRDGPVEIADAALLTDLYSLTMAASYWREGMGDDATFSLFVRRLPPNRGWLVAAGLDQALSFLEGFQFSAPAIEWLQSLDRFPPGFLETLGTTRFTGGVRAVPEGTLVFADEPLLEVTAPILEAQLVEAAVLNALHYATVVATKASRTVLAAGGRPVIEFGLRRTPGLPAGLVAVRSGWIGGIASTSNVLAGKVLGLPVSGTMAHSFVSAFLDEISAFRAFARSAPDGVVLLLDTYDTASAARKAVVLAGELSAVGRRLDGVRLDSGDLTEESRLVRRILDGAGLAEVQIVASGGLDEYEIERLRVAGAPIDAFGVGTRMDISDDAPQLDMAYKIVRYGGRDVLKLSGGKETWPGPKQVFRREIRGQLQGDSLGLSGEQCPEGSRPLLDPVMADGRRLEPVISLDAARTRCAEALAALPAETRQFRNPLPCSAAPTERLVALRDQVRADALVREVVPWGGTKPTALSPSH